MSHHSTPEFFGLQANHADEVVESSIDAYNNAFRGRVTLTESVYTDVNDQAEKLEELQTTVRNMIENCEDEILLGNLVLLFDSLELILTRHQELLKDYIDKVPDTPSPSSSSHNLHTSISSSSTSASHSGDAHVPPPLEYDTLSSSSSSSLSFEDEYYIHPSSFPTSTTTTTTTTSSSTSSTSSPLLPPEARTSIRQLGTSLRVALTQSTTLTTGNVENEKAVTCPICYMDSPVSQVFSFMACDHFYCLDCIREYFKNSASEGKILNICCPTPGCETTVQFEEIQAVMDKEWCEKFQDFAVLAFMRMDPTTRWCPKPNCSTAVMVDVDPNDPTTKKVTCPKCQYDYCYECALEFHGNTSCATWKKVNADTDDKFTKWASGKAKRCPKCNIFIEKNEGCNHMTCTSCDHQWCWLCMGDYSGNHYSEGNCAGRQFSAEADEHVFTVDAAGAVVVRRRRRPWKNAGRKALKITGYTAAAAVIAPVAVAGVAIYVAASPFIFLAGILSD